MTLRLTLTLLAASPPRALPPRTYQPAHSPTDPERPKPSHAPFTAHAATPGRPSPPAPLRRIVTRCYHRLTRCHLPIRHSATVPPKHVRFRIRPHLEVLCAPVSSTHPLRLASLCSCDYGYRIVIRHVVESTCAIDMYFPLPLLWKYLYDHVYSMLM